MKLIISYMKRHKAIIISGIITLLIFIVVFIAYALPVEAILYAGLLSSVTISVVTLFRFFAYRRRSRELIRMKNSILVSVENLPEALDEIERNYQSLITLLHQEHLAAESNKDRLINDMLDYYTTWAHQIKTPIAAMSLILQNRNDGQSQEQSRDELAEQLFRIEQYVEMVLGFIRSESISGDLVIRYYPLDELIKQSVKKYSRQFIRKRLKLEYVECNRRILTDEKWFCFVLEQLLSNSLKYTVKGSISISFCINEDGKGTVTISDTGIGICPEDLPRIGERGYTGYNGREDKKSTGIGLYLCRKITERLSCTFTITSEPLVGTNVSIGNIEIK